MKKEDEEKKEEEGREDQKEDHEKQGDEKEEEKDNKENLDERGGGTLRGAAAYKRVPCVSTWSVPEDIVVCAEHIRKRSLLWGRGVPLPWCSRR